MEALPERSFLHVAEAAGDIIAFQTVNPWNTFTTREFDHVATMGTYVDERHRRRGVGAALAAASFAAALKMGYEKIFTDLRADNLDSLAYHLALGFTCLLYTSDAADDLLCVDLGGRRIIKKKKK